MTPSMIEIVAGTVVQLGQYGVIVLAIREGVRLASHYIDHQASLPPVLPRRSAEEQAIDSARTAGLNVTMRDERTGTK